MCLFEKYSGTMFLGDHVLFDITPNIVNWVELENALGAYLDSLKKIMGYDVGTALPGHRTAGSLTMSERAAQLLDHHKERLLETEGIIRGTPGLSAYEIAGRMTWRIRAKNWDEFPPGQKWFAMGETMAHMDYLMGQGRIERNEGPGGIYTYTGR